LFTSANGLQGVLVSGLQTFMQFLLRCLPFFGVGGFQVPFAITIAVPHPPNFAPRRQVLRSISRDPALKWSATIDASTTQPELECVRRAMGAIRERGMFGEIHTLWRAIIAART
jgi:hypothetical protein